MSHRMVAVDSGHIDVRSIALIAVKNCSKAISALCVRHGKSPCFSEVSFLSLVGPDYPVLILSCANGQEFLECAF